MKANGGVKIESLIERLVNRMTGLLDSRKKEEGRDGWVI